MTWNRYDLEEMLDGPDRNEVLKAARKVGMSPDSVVVFGSIPAKYLTLLE